MPNTNFTVILTFRIIIPKALDDMQTKIIDNNLTKEERKQERNKRKSMKHRARLDSLREHMSEHHDPPKPAYIADNIAYAVIAGLEALPGRAL